MKEPIDERTLNLIGELSFASGMARGARDGIELMLKYGYTELQLKKLSSTFLEVAMIVENVTEALMGEDVYE